MINHDFYNFTDSPRRYRLRDFAGSNQGYNGKNRRRRDYGKVAVQTEFFEDLPEAAAVKFVIRRNDSVVAWKIVKASEAKEVVFDIADPELWDIGKPELYTVSVGTDNDFYETAFGIRKVSYDEKGLYINDRPVYLKGFGMHEDFLFSAKASSAVNVKSFELLKWINANSVRTSHYPYAEEIYDLADRYGILVIDEVPAVGMNHWEPTFAEGRADEQTLALHKKTLSLLIERDKNHPCVVMISVANEAATYEDGAREYFKNRESHAFAYRSADYKSGGNEIRRR
ncbi:MAG: glycoside hydrolase family 2 TIM barrel-domain containing protein [Christensenellales bacterium]